MFTQPLKEADVFLASNEDDLIYALGGDDFIFDRMGSDKVYAGEGNDIIRSGPGTDLFDGGMGIDTLFYDMAAFTGEVDTIEIDLEQSRIFNPDSPGTAEDTLSSIENVQILNTSINFNLVGDNNKNILLASAGNDTLFGGEGEDALYGGEGNDIFYASNGANDFNSGDFYFGGLGEDALNYSSIENNGQNILGSIEYDARNFVTGTFTNGVQSFGLNNLHSIKGFDLNGELLHQAYVADIEVIAGTGGNDKFYGSDKTSNFDSYVQLNALGLNDEAYEAFAPGLGEDLIDGGEGYDEVNYAWGAGSERSVNVNLSTGQAVITQNGLTYNDTVLNIEGVEGSNGNDIIVGSDGANSLDGRKGADEIDGGLGFDFVEYNGLFSEIVEVNLETGIAKDGHGFTDTLSNIEGVIGSNGDDIFTGKMGIDNIFYGKQGFDVLKLDGSLEDYEISRTTDSASGKDGFLVEKLDATANMPAIDSDLIFDIDALHFSIDGQFSPITASGYEHIILGREEDYFIGDIDRDWIETGGGADNIYAGAGDDVISIQPNGFFAWPTQMKFCCYG